MQVIVLAVIHVCASSLKSHMTEDPQSAGQSPPSAFLHKARCYPTVSSLLEGHCEEDPVAGWSALALLKRRHVRTE